MHHDEYRTDVLSKYMGDTVDICMRAHISSVRPRFRNKLRRLRKTAVDQSQRGNSRHIYEVKHKQACYCSTHEKKTFHKRQHQLPSLAHDAH